MFGGFKNLLDKWRPLQETWITAELNVLVMYFNARYVLAPCFTCRHSSTISGKSMTQYRIVVLAKSIHVSTMFLRKAV